MITTRIFATVICISAILTPGCGGGSGNSDKKTNKKVNIEDRYYGQWTSLINAEDKLYIDKSTVGEVTPKAEDDNIILYSVDGKSTRYVRDWRAGATASVSGRVNEIQQNVSSQRVVLMSGGIGGVANIEVVLKNVNNGEPVTTSTNAGGQFEVDNIEPGTYDIEGSDGSGENFSFNGIEAGIADNEIGIFTLVDESEKNFKSILSAREVRDYTFGFHQPYFIADYAPYRSVISVKNTGDLVAEGVNLNIDFSDPSIFSVSVVNGTERENNEWGVILNSLSPGETQEVDISDLRFSSIEEDSKSIVIPIEINDSRGNTWQDETVSTVYKRRLNINLKANYNARVYGKIFFPDSSVIHIEKFVNRDAIYEELPYFPGQKYVLMLYSQGSETPYSLHVDQQVDDSIESFTDTAAFEPDDVVANATVISPGQSHTSYISKEDFDYIEILMPEDIPESQQGITFFEKKVFATTTSTDVNDQNDKISRGESFGLYFSARNQSPSDIEVMLISLSTDDPYLTITESQFNQQFLFQENSVTDMYGDQLGNISYLQGGSGARVTVSDDAPSNHMGIVTATYTTYGNDYSVSIPIEIEPLLAEMGVYGVGEVLDGQTSFTQGNSDGAANPGETIAIGIAHQNSGSDTAYGVLATVTTDSEHVTVLTPTLTNSEYSYPPGKIRQKGESELNEGESVASGTSRGNTHEFEISGEAPSGHIATIDVSYRDQFGNEWSDEFSLTIE